MTADIFAAIANPVRRRILELLLERPRAAGEISAEFQLHRPAVSEHLQVLRLSRLVREEQIGRTRQYSLNPEALMEASAWMRPFERYWQERVAALRAVLEEDDDQDGDNRS
ncbi:ArsR/SmtB family transcription factor [Aminobacter sp. MET-1]|uniref:ArsR/SmtB family transcription factor n=1 Tax=Aminobacter sp. MET-1 TaxID=2951085 RepID=UPI002269A27F|nr:metalloregulator ArsR/SmtB family transcription factor [Aminobacter sp. MET-1]MCX8571251.1 metalloregulator ArsR/SmtB family transcription factor [Aminobacter sp. MET-1]